jgi:hypothetical protein
MPDEICQVASRFVRFQDAFPPGNENLLANTSLKKGVLFLCFYITNIFKSPFLCLTPSNSHLTTKHYIQNLKQLNLLLPTYSVILLVAVYVLCRNTVWEAAYFFYSTS